MSYIHIPVSLFFIFAELLVCLFVSLKQPATAGQFEIHKTFLKTRISQANLKCSALQGLQAFLF